MADTRKLDEAFNRFDAALRQFEAALSRQNERKSQEESLEAAAEALRLDRSRLAQELDGVRAKAASNCVSAASKRLNASSSLRVSAIFSQLLAGLCESLPALPIS